MDYQKVINKDGLEEQLSSFLGNNNNSGLFEIFTPGELNADILKTYFKDLLI